MAEFTQLRGIAWDHPRGLDPLRATAERYQHEHREVSIAWEARSLRDFEEQRISALAESYDIITIDHPFVGTAVQQDALIPLDEWLTPGFLADQAANSVGASHMSYQWEGRQWGLAIDASAQTSAYRADLLAKLGLAVPRTWSEVVALAEALPHGYSIAMPLNPTHLLCCFLAMCANRLDPDAVRSDDAISDWLATKLPTSALAAGVIEELYELTNHMAPACLEADPIQVLDQASSGDSIVYIPVIFAYCTYARQRVGHSVVSFGPVPSVDRTPRGAMLGGVGLAVSKRCTNPRVAVHYLHEVASGPWQRGIYAESGGQPGHRSAWNDPTVNGTYSDFFRSTLETLDLSFVRPRMCCYPTFQQRAGAEMHANFRVRADPSAITAKLGALWREHLDSHSAHAGATSRRR